MGLRCRVGDLAVAVRTVRGEHLGAIVRCVRFFGHARLGGELVPDCWVIEHRGTHISPNGLPWMMPDAWLRPIRPEPGTDETLIWAGLPKPTSTTLPERAGV